MKIDEILKRHEVASRELVAIVAASASHFRTIKTEPVICECCAQGAHEGNEPWVELVHTVEACDCKCNTSADSVEVIQ